MPFLDSHPDLCSLLDDPRIEGLATGLLGEDFNLMGSDGNYYAGDTHWHSDGGHQAGDPVHIKIALYLDTLAANSGSLRVIPGEHAAKLAQTRLLSPGAGDRMSARVQGVTSSMTPTPVP